jgi:hypothetical protein
MPVLIWEGLCLSLFGYLGIWDFVFGIWEVLARFEQEPGDDDPADGK